MSAESTLNPSLKDANRYASLAEIVAFDHAGHDGTSKRRQ